MPSNSSEQTSPNNNHLREDLLALLRCPVSRSPLRQEGDWLIAEVGGIAYPVRDGIPVMLAEEAKLPPGIDSLEEYRRQFGPPVA